MADLLDILDNLSSKNYTVFDLIASCLSNPQHFDHPALSDFLTKGDEILELFRKSAAAAPVITAWIERVALKMYADELVELTHPSTGLHFSARHATPEQLETFRIEGMAAKMQATAPRLWRLIQQLLTADHTLQRRREATWRKTERKPESEEFATRFDDDTEDMSLGDEADDMGTEQGGRSEEIHGTPNEARPCAARKRRDALLIIKGVVCISILGKSTNHNFNGLAILLGFFAHTSHTSERMIEMLAHAGLCVSKTAINETVNSLSKETHRAMKGLGRTLLAAVAYDNFDISFNVAVPTVESGGGSLAHLTSGTLLRIENGVTIEDLKCSRELWERSQDINFRMSAMAACNAKTTYDALLRLRPAYLDEFGQTYHQDFQSWRFRHDLVHYGPEYFRRFISCLGEPKDIEKVPVVKTHQIPVRAMDLNQSTTKGNADAIECILEQAGLGDPSEKEGVNDMSDYVVLVHGDLATCERVQSVQASRAIEKTPWRRFQYVVFVLALFHLKMACANVIWRIFLKLKQAHVDESSLMSHVGILRPSETLKVGSANPGFRRIHEIIMHDGIASRLDCWRVAAVQRNHSHSTLEKFAESKPSWQEIEEISRLLTKKFVAGPDIDNVRKKAAKDRDELFENSLLKNQAFLLYEELTYAMNVGDVGRVENCFLPWILLLRASGKYKYMKQMVKFQLDLHYLYPEPLRNAVRLNWLCNPTGKPGQFRGVDWLVERINLYTKSWYGGSFSNHTVPRVLNESPLVEIYRKMNCNIEDNFCLENRTINHTPPNMTRTLQVLGEHIKHLEENVYTPGRKVKYSIPNKFREGMHLLQKDLEDSSGTNDAEDEDEEVSITPEDLAD